MSFPQFQRFVLVCSLLVAAPFAQAGSRQIDASLLSTPSFERMSSSAGFGITANAATGTSSSDALQAVSAREAEERKAARQDDAASMAVPEPSSYLLLLAGLLAVGFVARRRGAD